MSAMGENEGYWRNGAMEREGKGAFIAMLFAIISSCNIYIYEVNCQKMALWLKVLYVL